MAPLAGALGPACRLRRRYAHAPAGALLTGLGAGEWSPLRSRPYALHCNANRTPTRSYAPALRGGQGQALRVLRNLDAAGRGRTTSVSALEGMPFPYLTQGNRPGYQ